ncbi:MAG: hypothetical protein ABL883_14300 [Terricaulis sp.]
MRSGWIVPLLVSLIGHIGAVMMTKMAWQSSMEITIPARGSVVPVEIVNIGEESNVRALAEETPEDAAPEEQQQTQEAAPEPAPGPPARERPRNRNDEFDLAAAARLANADTKTGRERNQGALAERNQRGAGLGTAEVAALRDRVNAVGRAHLRRCWRMPIDLPDPDRLVVTVEFDLNRNGSLNGQPRVTSPRNYTFDPYMRAAAEAALRAVRQCDPFPFPDDAVLREHYDAWRSPEIVFSPRF